MDVGPTDSTDPWSVSSADLRDHMRTLLDRDEGAVVVTIADVEGTAFRRPGAKMLVGADEEFVGAVTAGCLEDRVTELSMDVLDEASPRLAVFDLMEDDEDTWGLGLGCNGIIDVLLEPLDASWEPTLDRLGQGSPVTVLTVVESEDPAVRVGSRSIVENGAVEAVPDRESIPKEAFEAAVSVVEEIHGSGRTRSVDVETEGGRVTIMVDGLEPVSQLLLFGSQGDIHPVCKLAALIGFEVTVHSPRGARDAAAFPDAHHVRTGHPTTIVESVGPPDNSYAVVMSHNLLDDQLAIETLLEETDLRYIGLMGPRERYEKLREGSETIAEDGLERVATPVGLDLGGGAPIEIALSIVGEVLAVSNGRDGRRLNETTGPIHHRIDSTTE